jgi:hypothetical protein
MDPGDLVRTAIEQLSTHAGVQPLEARRMRQQQLGQRSQPFQAASHVDNIAVGDGRDRSVLFTILDLRPDVEVRANGDHSVKL